MPGEVRTIGLGWVNCYLLKAGDGYILIDTGFSGQRDRLARELAAAGCAPGKLRLIVLTHGDSDHIGNCAYLKEGFGAPVAMHRLDAGMIRGGDTASGRKARPDRITFLGRLVALMGKLAELRSGPKASCEEFSPDVYLEDGQDLSVYGLDGRVVHIPGHSPGSIGILTGGGELFCGDFLMNVFGPGRCFLIDDLEAFDASLAKLRSLQIGAVYPGHGKPFTLADHAGGG